MTRRRTACVFGALWLAAQTSGCSAYQDPGYKDGLPADTVHIEGTVRTVVNDFPAPAGKTWPAPTVGVVKDSVIVESTRYGSICSLDIWGYQSPEPGLNLTVVIEPRGYSPCEPGRAIRYHAAIARLPGTYQLTVVHDDRITPRRDTVVKRQTVVVP